jgi:peptidoglycan/xylan/chitin deacetylase (PgdA/CDA1 family)
MTSANLKNWIMSAACLLKADTLSRYINRNKLLVVMYHGVTECMHQPPIWTQLPLQIFREQMKFLRKHYVPVSIHDLIETIRNSAELPERSVLITFDDGLKNNYSVAYPLLQKMGIPATIFLTVDFIGSNDILWVDELYIIIREAASQGLRLELKDRVAMNYFLSGRIWEAYEVVVEYFKRAGFAKRTSEMNELRQMVQLDKHIKYDDFSMLDWDGVRTMHQSGLISFGVHTATHRILSELKEEEWKKEIDLPKLKLENKLQSEVTSFCFPNGRPLIDFKPEHLSYLREAGYSCAFTTENSLFNCQDGDFMQIGRVPAGNDNTSDMNYFRLNAAGVIQSIKGAM